MQLLRGRPWPEGNNARAGMAESAVAPPFSLYARIARAISARLGLTGAPQFAVTHNTFQDFN